MLYHARMCSAEPLPHNSVDASRTRQSLEGRVIEDLDQAALKHAIDLAFDFRGDVTITLYSSPEPIEGYIFDRIAAESPAESFVRLICKQGGERRSIPYADIKRVHFSGRDTAAGKSFETWMRKYVQKKRAGEAANIESDEEATEPLD